MSCAEIAAGKKASSVHKAIQRNGAFAT